MNKIDSLEGMILLKKEEIKIGKLVYIVGDDKSLYPLTIVNDDNYRDEETELAETEAIYYQEKNELYIPE